MINYIFRIFHVSIITLLLTFFVSCGYKGDPIYKPSPKAEQS